MWISVSSSVTQGSRNDSVRILGKASQAGHLLTYLHPPLLPSFSLRVCSSMDTQEKQNFSVTFHIPTRPHTTLAGPFFCIG